MPSCSRPAPDHVVVKHADKLIIGEPDGGSERARRDACARCSSAPASSPTPTRQRPPRDLVQIVGQCDDQPAVGADPGDRRQDPRRRRRAARGCSTAMAELAAVGAAIGCPISESGEDRMAVTARLGAFKTSMLQDVEAGPADRARGIARRAARDRAPARHPDARARPALRRDPADGRKPGPALGGGTTRPTHSPRPMRTAPSRFAPGAQRDLVAVLEEAARLAAGQARSAPCRRG